MLRQPVTCGNTQFWHFLAVREKRTKKHVFFVIARDRRTAPPNPAGSGFVCMRQREMRNLLHVNTAERKLLPKTRITTGGVTGAAGQRPRAGALEGCRPIFAVVLLISLDDHSNPMFSWKELLNLAKRVANKVHPGGSWYMARYFRGFTRFLFCFLRCLLSNK